VNKRRVFLALVAGSLLLAAVAPHALAQNATPFGVGRPDAVISGPLGGFGTWLMAEQSRFYKELAAAIRAAKADGTAAWLLIAISLAYGVFHAAGPGHGKAVLSAYLLASGETLRRGVLLAFVSAAVQALVAIGLVGALSVVIGATARQIDDAALLLEKLSYGLMALVGLVLVARKLAGLRALLARQGQLAAAGGPHVHGPGCGHDHAPLPNATRPFDLRSAAGTVMAIGIRPCTGAIIVLVFALAQGVFAAGIAAAFAMALGTAATVAAIAAVAVGAKGIAVRLMAPESFGAILAVRLMETAAALVVLLFGLTLLAGAVAMPG
jgi:nickel/cobalt transporter (NicO) family protein